METTPHLHVTPNKPLSPPLSGTLLLYNRSSTSDYKDDGHGWVKKRNSKKVREDHVKLRIGGKKRIAGCYVHGSDCTTFKRRAYHLLDYETGKTVVRPKIAGMKKVVDCNTNQKSAAGTARGGDDQPSLILIHYLDTIEASIKAVKGAKIVGQDKNIPTRKRASASYAAAAAAASRKRPAINVPPVPVEEDDVENEWVHRRPTISPDPNVTTASNQAIGNVASSSAAAAVAGSGTNNTFTQQRLNSNNDNVPNNSLQQLQSTALLLNQQQQMLQQNLALLPILQQNHLCGNLNSIGLQQVRAYLVLYVNCPALLLFRILVPQDVPNKFGCAKYLQPFPML